MKKAARRPYRLAVVANRPQPYHSAFFRALAAHPCLDPTVYYLYDVGVGPTPDADFGRYQTDYPVLDGYRSRFLRNRALRPDKSRFTGSFHPELLSRLQSRRHDAVLIHGWFGLSVWLAHLTCRTRRLPVLLRSDANAADLVAAEPGRLKRFLLSELLRRCHAFLPVGTRNAEFYRRYGVPDAKMFLTPCAVDNEFFQRQGSRLLPQRSRIRSELGLPTDAVVLLYTGRLSPEKRLGDLLEALRRLQDPRLWLLLGGEGRSRAELQRQARSLNLTRLLLTGLLGQEELARCYAAADIFVLPSEREPWGLVVNEAMNFGLPVVVSERAGAVPDLVEADGNGLVFPPGDLEALTECLRRLAADAGYRTRLGQRSLEKIRHWTHDSAPRAVLRALELALPKESSE